MDDDYAEYDAAATCDDGSCATWSCADNTVMVNWWIYADGSLTATGNPSIFFAKSISTLTSSLVLYSLLSSLLTFNASSIVIPRVNGINFAM